MDEDDDDLAAIRRDADAAMKRAAARKDCSRTTPCNDCPWRRKAAPGWLGEQFTPEDWANQARGDEMIPCHRTISGMQEEKQCVGMSIFRANICKLPRNVDQKPMKPDRELVFGSREEFITHHRSLGVVSSEMEES